MLRSTDLKYGQPKCSFETVTFLSDTNTKYKKVTKNLYDGDKTVKLITLCSNLKANRLV